MRTKTQSECPTWRPDLCMRLSCVCCRRICRGVSAATRGADARPLRSHNVHATSNLGCNPMYRGQRGQRIASPTCSKITQSCVRRAPLPPCAGEPAWLLAHPGKERSEPAVYCPRDRATPVPTRTTAGLSTAGNMCQRRRARMSCAAAGPHDGCARTCWRTQLTRPPLPPRRSPHPGHCCPLVPPRRPTPRFADLRPRRLRPGREAPHPTLVQPAQPEQLPRPPPL